MSLNASIEAANGLLDFLQNTVAPDYNHFVEIADQYGKDADNFEEKAGNISTMSSSQQMIADSLTDTVGRFKLD